MDRIKISEGVYLNLLESEKFKTDSIIINIIRPLSREEVTKNTLLPMVLKQGSEDYKNNITIQRKLEDLYGARLGANILVRGNKHIIRFYIDFIDKSYVTKDNYLEEILDIINSIVFKPKVENGYFNHDIVEQEKKNLKQKIDGKINDKRNYAIERTLEEMCSNESFGLSQLGYTEDLDNIDNINLYKYYLDILSTSPIEIYYGGRYVNFIKNYYDKNPIRTERSKIVKFERELIDNKIESVKKIREKYNINQGKLVLGYRSDIPYENSLYTSLLIGNLIFGGGPNSKLFLNVREKESLAYYIVSRLYKYKSIILVDCGIEFNDYSKALSIIKKELKDIQKGKFTEEDIKIAKKAIISALNSSKDSMDSLLEQGFSGLLSNDNRTIEDKIKDINLVERDDIIKAMNSLNLDTIYFMDGLGEGIDENI